MRRTGRSILGMAVAGILIIVPAAGAHANPFPNNYDDAVADSFIHTFCTTSGFTTDPSVATYAMNVLDSTTDLIDSDLGGCSSVTTDAWWWEENLPGGLRGQRTCFSHSSPGVCDSSDLKLDFGQLDVGSNDWYDRRKTSVHELGHSVGLGHDSISAMISGEVPSTALVWRRYSDHDIDHLNAQY